MRKSVICPAVATLVAGTLVWAGVAGAQPMHNDHTPPQAVSTSANAVPAMATGPRASVVRQIAEAQKKLISLADATPAEKFSWRPAQGVRSTGEVFMHVAAANYMLAAAWGAKVPDGVDPRGFDKNGADKAKVLSTLKQSFDFFNQSAAALSDADLHKSITVFGQQSTPFDVMLMGATHDHEHLGQSIAYARSNGIVPPWSKAGD